MSEKYNFHILHIAILFRKGVCMKEENATSIEYFRDFRRVADLINGVIFHGKPVVRECDLQEQNPVLHNIFKKDNKVSAVENTLDLFVMVTVNKAKFLLMLQGQTIEHYVMPVRASHERGTDYYNQWKKLQKMHLIKVQITIL